MKAIRAWFGYDSAGRQVEVAERLDGVYFCRSYEYNGYGQSWTKWTATQPTFETHTTNKYSGEVVEYDTPQMFWGFNRLDELKKVPRYRLPKP